MSGGHPLAFAAAKFYAAAIPAITRMSDKRRAVLHLLKMLARRALWVLIMARSRNIKPGFFKNETLAECQPLARLLFAGLWCLADREGRLEDRPKRIRAELLPYDDGSVDEMLNELHGAGFIVRYEAGGNRFIQVMDFTKHQTPHHKEQASTIHSPDLPKSSLGHTPDLPSSCPSDSFNLIPDSLNTDSLSSDAGASVVASKADNLQNQHPAKPDCPHKEIVALYHEKLPTCPVIRDWTATRATALRARWNEKQRTPES